MPKKLLKDSHFEDSSVLYCSSLMHNTLYNCVILTLQITGSNYHKCYQIDGTTLHNFGGKVKNLKLDTCLKTCEDLFKYTYITQGNKCYCSNELTFTAQVPDSICLIYGEVCSGEERCGGGAGVIAVWKIGNNSHKIFHNYSPLQYKTKLEIRKANQVQEGTRWNLHMSSFYIQLNLRKLINTVVTKNSDTGYCKNVLKLFR